MFHFIGFLFILIIAVLLIGLTLVGSIIRTIFGLGRRSSHSRSNNNTRRTYYANEESQESQAQASSPASHKKIFDKDEGEYVDFEEVKD